MLNTGHSLAESKWYFYQNCDTVYAEARTEPPTDPC
jgi:hypothetical protein